MASAILLRSVRAARPARWRLAVFLVGAALLAGCASAFRANLDAGDALVARGAYDDAVRAYEEASRLEPGDREAALKLASARRMAAAGRVRAGRARLSAGDSAAAFGLAVEAGRLDPASEEASRLAGEAAGALVASGEARLAAGDPIGALASVEGVLGASPDHAGARSLDARARDAFATSALERAEAAEREGLVGAALLEVAAAARLAPARSELEPRRRRLAATLRDEVTYVVQVGPFVALPEGASGGGELDLAGRLRAASVAASLDPALPLVLVDAPESAPRAPDTVFRGTVSGYAFLHARNAETRTREVPCETLAPNPGRVSAQGELERAVRRARRAESEVGLARADAERRGRALAEAELALDPPRRAARRARRALEACEARQAEGADLSACATSRREAASAERRLDEARARRNAAAAEAKAAEAEASDAARRAELARVEVAAATEALRATPSRVRVPSTCPERYPVDVHRLSTRATVGVETPARRASLPVAWTRAFERPRGDAEGVPDEAGARVALAREAASELADLVASGHDAVRSAFLARARLAAASSPPAAADAYARALASGAHRMSDAERREATAYCASVARLPEQVVVGALAP